MSKKQCPIFYGNLIYEMGHYLLDIQYKVHLYIEYTINSEIYLQIEFLQFIFIFSILARLNQYWIDTDFIFFSFDMKGNIIYILML